MNPYAGQRLHFVSIHDWLQGEPSPDRYAAFRASFEVPAPAHGVLRTLSGGWHQVWLDAQYLTEGPARFHRDFPEYDETPVLLAAGRHVIAIRAHHIGVETRMLEPLPPFLYCEMFVDGQPIPLNWRGCALTAYAATGRRINPQLGWVEWCDTRTLPRDWTTLEFDDSAWEEAVQVSPAIGPMNPLTLGPVQTFHHALRPIAEGELVETFGYALDDPPARFLLRDLAPRHVPRQGLWRRYDLGRVRLGHAAFTLDLPAGAVVEFGMAESLSNGRVAPHITLSAGASCNLSHFVARGGKQRFRPHTPTAGRYLEVHVIASEPVRFLEEVFDERCYFSAPEGAFECSDLLLNRIWHVGVETLRACAEDAITDNPTRERGQWTGDVAGVALEIAAAAYGDLRLLRRALTQAAQSARADGLIAGMSPGGAIYLSTYAAQWTTAVMRYVELSGDTALLRELHHYAERNMAALDAMLTDRAIDPAQAWAFVDWGYTPDEDGSDPATLLHVLEAARAAARWCKTIGEDTARFEAQAQRLDSLLNDYVRRRCDGDWARAGYHAATLALRNGLVSKTRRRECIDRLKAHLLDCFPNNPDSPRLSSPDVAERRIITPYFAHFALDALLRCGEGDFVFGQYRQCWGWALDLGLTTWPEVFDTRWSHCHEWSGCPTWQLSRHALGLHPRFDVSAPNGARAFAFALTPGDLSHARGRVPLPGGGAVEVEWSRRGAMIVYRLQTPVPLCVMDTPKGDVFVETSAEWSLDA